MIILATIVQSCIYAVPAAFAMILIWVKYSRARGQLRRACKTPTSGCAETALVEFLHANKIDDVAVEKGTDFLENAYEPDNKRITLSPDVYGSLDVCSVASALDAGAQALTCRNRPEPLVTLNRLQNASTWAFWIGFCVLAFSIMGAALVGACVGYAFLILAWALSARRRNLVKGSRVVVEDYVRRSGYFNSEECQNVLKALDSLRMNP
ncbi:MAG: zinc metallopeptidase [Thermoguttaceae bacterium]|nr:zinc metallopeptidase [Thermoguttaceae bacterium]